MRFLTEQFGYLRRLALNIGWARAIRVRIATMGARFGVGDSMVTILKPKGFERGLVARTFSTDFDVYGQVFKQCQYHIVSDLSPRTIVDLGANVGYASAYFLRAFPNARVIAVEPYPPNVEILTKNMEPYGERAEIISAAVWNRECMLVIDKWGGNEWGIEVRPARDDEVAEIRAIDLPSLGLERIDLLKIDIERAEIPLFSVNFESWLPTVSNIVIELHNQRCEEVFFSALQGYDYELSRSGELTMCRNIRKSAGISG